MVKNDFVLIGIYFITIMMYINKFYNSFQMSNIVLLGISYIITMVICKWINNKNVKKGLV